MVIIIRNPDCDKMFNLIKDKYKMSFPEIIIALLSNDSFFSSDDQLKKIQKKIQMSIEMKKSKEDARSIYHIANFEARLIKMMSHESIQTDEILNHIKAHRIIMKLDPKNKKEFKKIFGMRKKSIIDLRLKIASLKIKYPIMYICAMGISDINNIYDISNTDYKIKIDQIKEPDKKFRMLENKRNAEFKENMPDEDKK